MNPTVVVTVEYLRSGQPHPYADSIYEAILTLDGEWYGKRPDFGAEVIKEYAKALVRPFRIMKGEAKEWHEPFCELTKLEPSKWRVVVTQPYLD